MRAGGVRWERQQARAADDVAAVRHACSVQGAPRKPAGDRKELAPPTRASSAARCGRGAASRREKRARPPPGRAAATHAALLQQRDAVERAIRPARSSTHRVEAVAVALAGGCGVGDGVEEVGQRQRRRSRPRPSRAPRLRPAGRHQDIPHREVIVPRDERELAAGERLAARREPAPVGQRGSSSSSSRAGPISSMLERLRRSRGRSVPALQPVREGPPAIRRSAPASASAARPPGGRRGRSRQAPVADRHQPAGEHPRHARARCAGGVAELVEHACLGGALRAPTFAMPHGSVARWCEAVQDGSRPRSAPAGRHDGVPRSAASRRRGAPPRPRAVRRRLAAPRFRPSATRARRSEPPNGQRARREQATARPRPRADLVGQRVPPRRGLQRQQVARDAAAREVREWRLEHEPGLAQPAARRGAATARQQRVGEAVLRQPARPRLDVARSSHPL